MASSSDISPAKASSSPSPSKLEQRNQKLTVRKRVISPPGPEPIILAGKTTSPKKSGYKDGSSGHGEVKSSAMDRALEIQKKLPSKFPSFVKYMYMAHVSAGYWLHFKKSFCVSRLPKQVVPKQGVPITLVDEVGKAYNTKYLSDIHGLSGGWRRFSMEHNLVVGDVLVFQLIESLKFKVYIVRASQTAEANGASSSLLNLHSQAKTLEIKNEFEDVNNAEMIAGKDMCVEVHEKTSDSEHVAEGTRLAKPISQFKDVDGFRSFNIIVDGLAIETDIPVNLQYTYYRLCVDQKSFLHNDLIKGLKSEVAAGIISETATIADAIKPAKLTVSLKKLQYWDRRLQEFEDKGMKVGFLRARINKLESWLCEQHEIFRSKKQEQNQLEEKIKVVESEQLKLYEAKIAVDDEIEALMVKNSSLEVTLKNTAAAW